MRSIRKVICVGNRPIRFVQLGLKRNFLIRHNSKSLSQEVVLVSNRTIIKHSKWRTWWYPVSVNS